MPKSRLTTTNNNPIFSRTTLTFLLAGCSLVVGCGEDDDAGRGDGNSRFDQVAGGRSQRALKSIERELDGDLTLTEFTYDGTQLTRVTVRRGAEIWREVDVEYEGGRVSAAVTRSFNPGGSLGSTQDLRLEYNSEGRLLRATLDIDATSGVGSRRVETTFSYDSGLLDRESHVDSMFSEDPITSSYTYEDGRLKENRTLSDFIDVQTEYSYDSQGRLQRVLSLQGSSATRYEVRFSSTGRVDEVRVDDDSWELDYTSEGLIETVDRAFTDIFGGFQRQTTRFEYEDFNVQGFAFLPTEAAGFIVGTMMDVGGRTFAVPDATSLTISGIL